MHRLHIALSMLLMVGSMSLVGPALAASLTLQNTYGLATDLSYPSSNHHPQGLGYDASANELLFMQQSSQRIYRTDLAGNILGSVAVSQNHTVSVAADANYYYYGDYTANSTGVDMFRLAKSGGATPYSSETVAYGGYPIDVRDGNLYRTNVSTSYNYGPLNQIRISPTGAPDSITTTINLSGVNGIGDIGVDVASDSVWTLDYTSNASVRRFSLSTGALLDTFALGVDGITAGITVTDDNRLFYYDWQSGSGSTLSEYSISGIAVVPQPSAFAALFSLCLSFALFGLKPVLLRARSRIAISE